MAFTSSRPGCTQLINFYRVGDGWFLPISPGMDSREYLPKKKQEWKRLIERYLQQRKPLALCVILLDARRGWMEQ